MKIETKYITVCGLIKELESLREDGHGGKYVVVNGGQQSNPNAITDVDVETVLIGGYGAKDMKVVEIWTRWGTD